MSAADAVSRYVESLEVDPDSASVRAMIHGILAGTAMGPLTQVVKVANVEIDKDVDGNYLSYFIIETVSGRRFRVSVEME